MTPESSGPRADRRGGRVLALVLGTIGWIVLAFGLFAWAFLANFCLDAQTCEELRSDGVAEWPIAVGISLGALVVLAVLPFALRMPKTGAVYAAAVLAVLILLAQSGAARETARDLLRDDPPAGEYDPGPQPCLPRSGGDAECPGG
ncbi:hypothetical protein GCM10009853_093710 [Glycomyces scopariae]